jgi:hypothetical protein
LGGLDDGLSSDYARCAAREQEGGGDSMTPDDLLGLSRLPGTFKRTDAGAPLVAHPTEMLKDGSRPKNVVYGRPSSFGKQIENTYNLMKWAERRVALGVVADVEVYEAACALLQLPLDSPEFRESADKVAAAAKRAALATEAAERGTHAHQLTEDDDEGASWLKRAEEGEDLGIPREAQNGMVVAWRQMLQQEGLEILAVEAAVVHDGWRKAGTLDRIARLTKPLTFTHNGETVTLPAGTVVVLDIKTGKLALGRDGLPNYWNSYAVQIAVYANAVPYDTLTDTRTVWPFEINIEWALIAHLPVLDAINGEAVCRLVPVDIAAGARAAELCIAASSWESNRQVFGVIDRQVVVSMLHPRRTHLQQRIEAVKEAGLGQRLVIALQAAELPTLKQADDHTAEQLDLMDEIVGRFEKEASLGFAPPPAMPKPETLEELAVAAETVISRTRHTEGEQVDDATYDAIQQRYEALTPEARAWVGARAGEAMRAGLPFHLKGNPTELRFAVLRGALAGWNLGDELYRHALHLVTGEEYALQETIALGGVMGSLTIDEANRAALLLEDLASETVAVQLTLTGDISFTGDLAAYLAA